MTQNRLDHLFRRRPKPEGRWSLAHPVREPARFVGQSVVAWPAAALAAIMIAAPANNDTQLPQIVIWALQATVVYPIIVIVAFAIYFGLIRLNQPALAPLPLIVPMAIAGLWVVTFGLFVIRYGLSLLGVV